VVHPHNEIQNRADEEMAKTLRKHRPLLMSCFKARGELSSGVVEGFKVHL